MNVRGTSESFRLRLGGPSFVISFKSRIAARALGMRIIGLGFVYVSRHRVFRKCVD